MKAKSRTPLIPIAAFSLAVFSVVGCTEKKAVAEAVTPAANNQPTATPASVSPNNNTQVTFADWNDIKDDTYEQRAHFLAGLKQLEAKVDAQIAELAAKRATMKGTTSTKDWDFAMKEMENSRTYLVSTGEELSTATADTWDQKKEKVGQAWVKTQDAYDKVKASTTS